MTIDGEMWDIIIRVLEVTKRKDLFNIYYEHEVNFPFRKGTKPPLEIGQTYLFEAIYTSHGTAFTKIEPAKNPQTKP